MRHLYLQLLLGLLLCCCSLSSSAQLVSIAQPKVEQKKELSEIKIFPNPATDRFKISLPSTSVKYITINNIIGKQIRKVYASSDKYYNVEDLKKGVYIIRIFDTNEELVKALRLSKA